MKKTTKVRVTDWKIRILEYFEYLKIRFDSLPDMDFKAKFGT